VGKMAVSSWSLWGEKMSMSTLDASNMIGAWTAPARGHNVCLMATNPSAESFKTMSCTDFVHPPTLPSASHNHEVSLQQGRADLALPGRKSPVIEQPATLGDTWTTDGDHEGSDQLASGLSDKECRPSQTFDNSQRGALFGTTFPICCEGNEIADSEIERGGEAVELHKGVPESLWEPMDFFASHATANLGNAAGQPPTKQACSVATELLERIQRHEARLVSSEHLRLDDTPTATASQQALQQSQPSACATWRQGSNTSDIIFSGLQGQVKPSDLSRTGQKCANLEVACQNGLSNSRTVTPIGDIFDTSRGIIPSMPPVYTATFPAFECVLSVCQEGYKSAAMPACDKEAFGVLVSGTLEQASRRCSEWCKRHRTHGFSQALKAEDTLVESGTTSVALSGCALGGVHH
jgi:hypothetical protein